MLKKFSTTASGAYVLLLWCAYWNTSYISHKHCKTTQALFVPFGWKFFHNTAKLIFHGYLYISIYLSIILFVIIPTMLILIYFNIC